MALQNENAVLLMTWAKRLAIFFFWLREKVYLCHTVYTPCLSDFLSPTSIKRKDTDPRTLMRSGLLFCYFSLTPIQGGFVYSRRAMAHKRTTTYKQNKNHFIKKIY